MSDNPVFLYVGEYDSVDDAKADLEALKEMHREHVVGTYDAAVVTKNEEGKVKIVDKIEKPTQHGGWAGMAVGAAIGLIFPPGILVSGLLGAGAGALIGHLEGGMSRSDVKEVGEMLDNSEAALIVVGRRRSSGRSTRLPRGPSGISRKRSGPTPGRWKRPSTKRSPKDPRPLACAQARGS